MNLYIKTILLIMIVLLPVLNYGQSEGDTQGKENSSSADASSDVKISGQWFLNFYNKNESSENFNEFSIKRGYITLSKSLNKTFSVRYTQDITIDEEGDGSGDIKTRVKYAYLKTKLPSYSLFTEPFIEFGIVHRPWLDYEQKINDYRVQGTMFLERNGMFNSADYGLTLVSLLGGKIDSDYQKTVNKNYPGKFGSIAVGVYNGGGYHALTNNNHKTIEGRLSIRPLPEIVPGFQISYLGLIGKGNTAESPDFNFNSGFISYENQRVVLTATYYAGKGVQNGRVVDSLGNSYDQDGYSFFGEYKFFLLNFSLFGRYDNFNTDKIPSTENSERIIAGIAYRFINGSKLLIDYDENITTFIKSEKITVITAGVEVRF